MRYLRYYEKIEPSKIEDILGDNWEDDESEEDDFKDFLSDKLKGGTIYRATFYATILNTSNGEIFEIDMSKLKNFYWEDTWGYPLPLNLLNIDFNVEELEIDELNKKDSYILISKDNKKKYSIKDTVLTKDSKLNNFYIRVNDILSFNEKGIRDGLISLFEKNEKRLFNSLMKKVPNEKKILKNISSHEHILSKENKKIEEINFLMDNVDKIGVYININQIKNDTPNIKRKIKKTEEYIEKLKITLNNYEDISKESIFDKIRNFKL